MLKLEKQKGRKNYARRESSNESSNMMPPKRESDDSKFPSLTTFNHSRVFTKTIVGDIFGTHDSDAFAKSLAYRTRVIARSDLEHVELEKIEEAADSLASTSLDELKEEDGDLDEEFAMLGRMNPKQKTALTLKNWSTKPENDERLIKEGIQWFFVITTIVTTIAYLQF